MDAMIRGFFLGFIKIHILHHAAREPVYGLWLIEELGRHGYALSPGTLYPILHSLEEAGYVAAERANVKGKVRKYYKTTASGRRALTVSTKRAQELLNEILEE
jgi:PadR family transcriptional regulator, regulatory protein PadR